VAVLVLAGCSALQSDRSANRPDGEGYAGTGAVVMRIGVQGGSAGWLPNPFASRPERAAVEIRYLGLDASGRAVFLRHDDDAIAGKGRAVSPGALPADAALQDGAPAAAADSRQIVVDLRTTRQIHVQGKIIEVIEATAEGVVFRIY
jgi:hypothetical protein